MWVDSPVIDGHLTVFTMQRANAKSVKTHNLGRNQHEANIEGLVHWIPGGKLQTTRRWKVNGFGITFTVQYSRQLFLGVHTDSLVCHCAYNCQQCGHFQREQFYEGRLKESTKITTLHCTHYPSDSSASWRSMRTSCLTTINCCLYESLWLLFIVPQYNLSAEVFQQFEGLC